MAFIPAVAQDAATGKVLMVAYMNEEALSQTIEKKRPYIIAVVEINYGIRVKPVAMFKKSSKYLPIVIRTLSF